LLQTRLAQFHFGVEYEKIQEEVHLAFMQYLAGDNSGAAVTGKQARDALVRFYGNEPDDGFNAELLSEAYAMMGERDSAVKQAERAKIAQDPGPKDAISTPRAGENLALIQTIIGNNSGAISELAQLLEVPYHSWLYYAGLSQARSVLGSFARRSRLPKTLPGKAEVKTRIARMGTNG